MRLSVRAPRHVRRRAKRNLRKVRDPQVRHRLLIVAQVLDGGTSGSVSDQMRCARSTVIRLFHRYHDLGLEGLEDRRRENGTPRVTDRVEALILAMVRGVPRDFGQARSTWTRELMMQVIARRLRVRLSITTIGRVLRRLNIGWRRARPVLLKACSRRRYRAFGRHIERLIDRATAREEVFFVDEMDVHLNPRIGNDWTLRGKQKAIQTPGTNRKRYLAGAYNPSTGNLVWTVHTNKRSELFIQLLEELSRRYRRAERLHVILDNYGIHTSRVTQRYLERHGQRFELHFVPPYGQDLNAIERLWKQVHDNVTRNHRWATIDQLVRAIERFLREAIPFPGAKPSTARC